MRNLREMSSVELKAVGKELKIKNWWKLTKTQLIELISEAREPVAKKKRKQYEYDGRSQHLCAWARELNINPNTLYNRIHYKGMSFEDAIRKSQD